MVETEFGRWLGRSNGDVMVADCLKGDCTAEQMKAVATTYCIIFGIEVNSEEWEDLLRRVYDYYNCWFDTFEALKDYCTAQNVQEQTMPGKDRITKEDTDIVRDKLESIPFQQYGMYESVYTDDQKLIISEVCGDWKHTHKYLDVLMGDFGYALLSEVSREGDEDIVNDWYTSDHIYRKKENENGRDQLR